MGLEQKAPRGSVAVPGQHIQVKVIWGRAFPNYAGIIPYSILVAKGVH